MSERWLPVPGFEGSYEVSDLGRVRSLDRVVLCTRGQKTYEQKLSGALRVPHKNTSGHLQIRFGRYGPTMLVHVLVMLCFVGEKPESADVRHLNGVHTDNRLTNLQYASRSRNMQDKKWHAGATHYVLKPAQVLSIKRRLLGYYRGLGAELADEYGVSRGTISAIRCGKVHNDIRASL